jgi:hypothetical protein
MAFNARGTDYGGYQSSMDSADRQRTSAEDAAGKAAKQRRIDSETSSMSGIANIARIGAAIYTGGASEATGLGAMGSKALQGKKSDGSDYDDQMGDIIGTVAGGYNMMEGMKQKDISNLKAEDIAAYDRQIDFAKQFPEGSEGRQNALFAARDSLQGTRDTQKYGERADSNPFTYKKGRYKGAAVPEASSAVPEAADTDIVPDTVQKGKAEFDSRQIDRGPSGEDLDKGGREERDNALLRSRIRDTQTADRGPSGEQLDKGGREERVQRQLDKQNALKEASLSDREGSYNRHYKSDAAVDRQLAEAEEGMSVGKIDEDRMWKRLSNEDDIDREYNKKILDERGASFVGAGSDISNAEMEANVAGRNALIEAQNKKGSYSEPVYKTFSEKEAEKLSRKDTDKSSAMDDIAFDKKGGALKERGGFLRGFDKLLDPKQGKEDAQHLFEYNLQQEKVQKNARKLEERTRAGEFTPSIKSALKKRVEARKRAREIAIKKGGILAQ